MHLRHLCLSPDVYHSRLAISLMPWMTGKALSAQGSVSWRPTTVKWRQFSQPNHHSTIGARQTEYHEALPSSVNNEVRCECTFAYDGNTSWYSVCWVPMVEWQLDCCHLTVVGLPWYRLQITASTGCRVDSQVLLFSEVTLSTVHPADVFTNLSTEQSRKFSTPPSLELLSSSVTPKVK